MPLSLLKRPIIGVLVLLLPWLAGCSSIRLAYANGPQLAWWWLDGYVDFSREQAPEAKRAVERWFDWHRATQLGDYATLLALAQPQVLESTTAPAACRWQQQLRDALDPAIDRSITEFAELLPGLGEAQFSHLAQRYAKRNAEMRADFLQADPAERQRQSLRRTVERAERLYGRLGQVQLQVIRDGLADSPFDPEAWLAERQRSQTDTLATLRRLVAEKVDADTRVAALRALVLRSERSPDTRYRDYQQRLAAYNCEFTARIHNATTAEQRQRARERLQGWEEDLRGLAGAPDPASMGSRP